MAWVHHARPLSCVQARDNTVVNCTTYVPAGYQVAVPIRCSEALRACMLPIRSAKVPLKCRHFIGELSPQAIVRHLRVVPSIAKSSVFFNRKSSFVRGNSTFCQFTMETSGERMPFIICCTTKETSCRLADWSPQQRESYSAAKPNGRSRSTPHCGNTCTSGSPAPRHRTRSS